MGLEKKKREGGAGGAGPRVQNPWLDNNRPPGAWKAEEKKRARAAGHALATLGLALSYQTIVSFRFDRAQIVSYTAYRTILSSVLGGRWGGGPQAGSLQRSREQCAVIGAGSQRVRNPPGNSCRSSR